MNRTNQRGRSSKITLAADAERNVRLFFDFGHGGYADAMREKLLTDKEVAELTGLSRVTLFRLRRKRQISFFTLADGRSIRYAPQHIETYLLSHERPARAKKPISICDVK